MEPAEPAWVPPVGEVLGEERARLLVAWLREHARPAVDDAVQTIRARFPSAEVQVDLCRVAQLAPQTRPSYRHGIYAGNVWVSTYVAGVAAGVPVSGVASGSTTCGASTLTRYVVSKFKPCASTAPRTANSCSPSGSGASSST